MTSFPLEARVVLQGLVKAPDLNGKVGVVKSGVTDGRHQVYVHDLSKLVGLKASNLRYEGRSPESLSSKQLKTVLKSKNVADSELTGIDKSDLQSKVSDLHLSEENIAEILAITNAPKPSSTTRTTAQNPAIDLTQAASQLENTSPEQLRQQARAMKMMDPAAVRRMNPQFANMTDAQLRMAADQMMMMADNPEMVKAASNKIKNMSPQEMQSMQNQTVGGNQSSSSAATTTKPAPATPSSQPRAPPSSSGTASKEARFQQASNMMANMTPEQLKQQAEMMRTTDPDTLRIMNPQLAHMTNEQIKMAASQFEMMSSNPELMKMAMDQMKNLTPEQMEDMKNGNPPNTTNPNMEGAAADPASMLANMDKKQLKQMLKQLKENPEMMKQFAKMTGLSEGQLSQGVDMFANMDDDKLDKAVNVMQKAQKAKDLWTKADAKTGGHLKKIIIVVVLLLVSLIVKKIWFSSGGSASIPAANPLDEIPSVAAASTAEVDEFDSEF